MMECENCEGHGEYPLMVKCNDCRGTGEVAPDRKDECRNCNGAGAAPCMLCGGTGKVEPEEGSYQWAVKQLDEGKEVQARTTDDLRWLDIGIAGPRMYFVNAHTILHNTTRAFRFKPAPPEEGTHAWAEQQLNKEQRIECQWNKHPYNWHEVVLSTEKHVLWENGSQVEFPINRHYRLRTLDPTPPKPEIVEWPRCEEDNIYIRYTRPNCALPPYRRSELCDLKEWQLVNFSIPLPNGDIVRLRCDHIWWNPAKSRWSFAHETEHACGKPGYTQRIDARGVNMLRRTE